MVAQGHSVDLYARSSYTMYSSWGQRYEYKGVCVKTLPSIPIKGLDALWTSGLAAIATSGQTYDIIHFHALGPSLFTTIPKLTAPNAKIVVTCHGLDWQRNKWGKFSQHLIQQGEKCAVRFAHAMAVVAPDLQDYFQETYGRFLPYISNGPARYHNSDASYSYIKSLGLPPHKYVFFLGRLVPEKCPDVLIRAFQRLRPSGWQVAIAGGNSHTSDYIADLQRLTQDDPTMVLTGEVRGSYLAELMRGAGLFCLPSQVEGLPLVLLEAMNEGVPVLVSDIPIHQRLIGIDRGRLFEVGNVDDCAKQLAWAIANLNTMQQYAHNAHSYIKQNHSWESITDDWLNVYNEICNAPKSMIGDGPMVGSTSGCGSVSAG